MDPCDFLKIADGLKNSCEEAGRRSAVSRAYYAAFHYIRLYLVREGIDVPQGGTIHDKIPKYLRYSGLQKAKDVAKCMQELRDDRKEADYKIALEDLKSREDRKVLERFNTKTCELLVNKAQQIIQDFNSCKGQELIQGIENYKTVTKT